MAPSSDIGETHPVEESVHAVANKSVDEVVYMCVRLVCQL